MNNSRIISIILVFVMLGVYLSGLSSGPKVKVMGDEVTVKSGRVTVILHREEERIDNTYRIFAASHKYYDFYNACFSAIPLEQVKMIERRYGELSQPDSPGQVYAKANMHTLNLIGQDPKVMKEIKKIYDKTQELNGELLVRIQGTKLTLVDYKKKVRIPALSTLHSRNSLSSFNAEKRRAESSRDQFLARRYSPGSGDYLVTSISVELTSPGI